MSALLSMRALSQACKSLLKSPNLCSRTPLLVLRPSRSVLSFSIVASLAATISTRPSPQADKASKPCWCSVRRRSSSLLSCEIWALLFATVSVRLISREARVFTSCGCPSCMVGTSRRRPISDSISTPLALLADTISARLDSQAVRLARPCFCSSWRLATSAPNCAICALLADTICVMLASRTARDLISSRIRSISDRSAAAARDSPLRVSRSVLSSSISALLAATTSERLASHAANAATPCSCSSCREKTSVLSRAICAFRAATILARLASQSDKLAMPCCCSARSIAISAPSCAICFVFIVTLCESSASCVARASIACCCSPCSSANDPRMRSILFLSTCLPHMLKISVTSSTVLFSIVRIALAWVRSFFFSSFMSLAHESKHTFMSDEFEFAIMRRALAVPASMAFLSLRSFCW
mmetsp:Transcript_79675/g.146529  ORF Transcript_79675/g.146529 Transcript_79675/m.146529 type:complete len:417 (-) Transcript_79675:178-1428(-)